MPRLPRHHRGPRGRPAGFAALARCPYEDAIVTTVLTNDESLVTADVNTLADEAPGND